MSVVFDTQACGCYVDGANGEQHLREVLANLIDGLGGDKQLARDLTRPPCPEVAADAIWDAVNLLQEHTETGCLWMLEAGDLLLVTEEQAQSY
jgi:hypothetical protein